MGFLDLQPHKVCGLPAGLACAIFAKTSLGLPARGLSTISRICTGCSVLGASITNDVTADMGRVGVKPMLFGDRMQLSELSDANFSEQNTDTAYCVHVLRRYSRKMLYVFSVRPHFVLHVWPPQRDSRGDIVIPASFDCRPLHWRAWFRVRTLQHCKERRSRGRCAKHRPYAYVARS